MKTKPSCTSSWEHYQEDMEREAKEWAADESEKLRAQEINDD